MILEKYYWWDCDVLEETEEAGRKVRDLYTVGSFTRF